MHRPAGNYYNLNQMYFSKYEIENYKVELCHEHGRVRLEEISDRMGVKPHVVRTWEKDELLSLKEKIGSNRFFDRTAIEEFVQSHVFTAKAAQILGVHHLTIQTWARKGRLKPISDGPVDGLHDYLFRKQDVLRFLSNGMNTAQMAEHLGITEYQLRCRIKKGLIHPISGLGIDETGRYLFSSDWRNNPFSTN